jgi:hypothetical protein
LLRVVLVGHLLTRNNLYAGWSYFYEEGVLGSGLAHPK